MLGIYASSLAVAQSQNALDFDGIDDEVVVPGASSLIAGSNQLSITCWVYPTNSNPMYPDFDGFAGFRNELDCDFYVMQVSPSTAIEARLRNSAGGFYTITYQGLQLNVWQHLALTFDGSYLRLFTGGVLADSVPASGGITNTAEAFHIGSLPYGTNPYWLTGKTDEISLWNRALTPAEISCIAQESVNADDPGCMLFYTCNQGIADGDNTAITVLDDESGHIDGNLTSMAMTGTFSNFVAGIQNAASSAQTICQGETYQWGTEMLTQAGYYYNTQPLNGGCGNLQELNLIVLAVDTAVSLAGETLTANAAGAAYQWIDCNNGNAVIPNETSQSFTPAADGNYACIVTTGICADTSSCMSVVGVGTHHHDFISQVKVYPNPVHDKLILMNLNTSAMTELQISDAMGKILLQSVVQENKVTVDAASWPAGIYFIALKSGAQNGHLRMIRE